MALARVSLRQLARCVSGARVFDVASLLVIAVTSLVMLFTLPDYGITYDEEAHLRLGDRVLQFYASGLESSGTLRRTSYGAGFDVLSALMRRVSPWGAFETNHLACVFVAQLGLLGTWKLGRLLGGPAGGLAALTFLVLTPVYYGHQFNNPKDIPFAAGYIWGLYWLARLSLALAAGHAGLSGYRFWLGLAVVLALGMSVRLGGAVLIGYLLVLLAAHALDAWRLQGWRSVRRFGRVSFHAGLAVALGWGLMTPFWPRALSKPIQAPAAAIESVTRFTAYDSPTLLRGARLSSNQVPWDYLPTYFAGQLPELLSLTFVIGVLLLGASTWRCVRSSRPLPWAEWLLVMAVCLPPAYAMLRGSTLYNGLRHFLFLIPPLCVFAGVRLSALLHGVASRRPTYAWLAAVPLLVFAVDQANTMRRLHPHQHVYFNRAFGGIAEAVGRYETEYYGSVYKELLSELRERLWQERRAVFFERSLRVTGCGSKLFFTQNLPLNFQYQSLNQRKPADFFASYVRDDCLKRFRDRREIVRVEREGAVLGVARDLKRKRR